MSQQDFFENTIDPSHFVIQNVEGDNACFYRAIANYIYFAIPEYNIKKLKKLDSLTTNISEWGKTKNIEIVNKKYGRYSEDQEELARTIQKRIVKYIKQNKDKILHETGMSIKDSIPLIHEISCEEYIKSYKSFAGDIDIDEELIDEDYYIDKWGSIIEQAVLSEILECPIVVYNSQKYDTKFNKIVNGKIIKNKPEKDVRLKLSSISGGKYMGKLPIFILWKELYKNGHYYVCYPKQTDNLYDLIITS